MNTLSAHAIPAQHNCMPVRGWRLDARRAMISSRSFRIGLREGERYRFFASCWVMVEAPPFLPIKNTAILSIMPMKQL